jgi:hypothetical protein
MKMRSLLVSFGLLWTFAGLFGQQAEVSVISSDEAAFKSLKKLTLPVGYATRPLPSKKDNSRLIYFSGIYNQEVWNCNQAASIWTMFTYEINYLRNLNSSLPENQYSPMAVYNLLNYGNPGQGVSYFDSWNLVRSNGIPGNPDFSAYNQNSQIWMTGYDKYYRGMKNRVDEVFAIDVGNPEGFLTLKHWINDHLNGSQVGGVANFQIGSGDMVIPQIPLDKGLEEEGQFIVIKYGPWVGHAMTFVGWNDSVRYDVNGDGRYTNDIDINGDHIVDMKDWEIGAMLVVNSWGSYYNAGKLWVMYRLLAEKTTDGGIWNNAVMVIKPKKAYNPLLTIKANIRYNKRNLIKIQVGVSGDLDAREPDKIMDFPCFNYQGDTLPMQGFSGVNSDLIEIGLDITPMLNDIPENGQAKVFLEVIQKTSKNLGSGNIEGFSVMDYTHGANEYVCPESQVPIARNALTRISVPINTNVIKPQILTDELPDAEVGQAYRYQIEADGTTGPYRYTNPANEYFESPDESTINFSGGSNVFSQPNVAETVIDLPFSFPFFGASHNQITVLADGGIVMGLKLVKYPYVIDGRLRMYQNCGVFPLFGNLYYPEANNKVTFEGSAAEVIIRWHATVDPEGLQPVEFAAKLLPDGQIKLYYGDVNMTPDIAWISGISAGNMLDYHLMNHNTSGIKTNTSFNLKLLDWPSWLDLGSNGDLSGTPDKSGLYSLPMKVTDWTGITNNKTLILKVTGGSGVTSQEIRGGIRIFPNPATDILWLQGYTDHPGSMNLSVFDLSGHRIFTKVFDVPLGNVLIPLREVETLPQGVYFYQIKGIIEDSGRFIRQ